MVSLVFKAHKEREYIYFPQIKIFLKLLFLFATLLTHRTHQSSDNFSIEWLDSGPDVHYECASNLTKWQWPELCECCVLLKTEKLLSWSCRNAERPQDGALTVTIPLQQPDTWLGNYSVSAAFTSVPRVWALKTTPSSLPFIYLQMYCKLNINWTGEKHSWLTPLILSKCFKKKIHWKQTCFCVYTEIIY